MEIKVFKSEKKLDEFVAQIIIDYINTHQESVIGFATGSTPLGTYQCLIDAYNQGKVDFSKIHEFNLDEYVGIERNHPLSFASQMRTYLFDSINVPVSQIHSLNGAAKDMEEECHRYEEEINEHPINIQILGIGMDGHIAYNEPGTSFDSLTHTVKLHDESIESSLDYGFDDIKDVPKFGVTQGIKTIMKADLLIMMAKGKKKAELVKRMIEGEVSEDFPSSIIQRHENVIVVLDEEASSQLGG